MEKDRGTENILATRGEKNLLNLIRKLAFGSITIEKRDDKVVKVTFSPTIDPAQFAD